MKLFTKDINERLFAQYHLGNNLEKQEVVAKIFNPYGQGRWYLVNSDPADPNYLWAIVQMGGVVEVGSIHREDIEKARVRPFNLPLERDLSFRPENAEVVFQGLLAGKFFKNGGKVEEPTVVRTQFEEEEFEYGSGGEINPRGIAKGTDYHVWLNLPYRTDFYLKSDAKGFGIGSIMVIDKYDEKEHQHTGKWSVNERKYNVLQGGYYDTIKDDLTKAEAFALAKEILHKKK